MTLPHLALLGDSIFDNAAYTAGAPDVITLLRRGVAVGVARVVAAMFSHRGLDVALGQRVPRLLQQRPDLELITIDSDSSVERGGSALARMMSMSAALLSDRYVGTGRASLDDVLGYQRFAADPSCWGIFFYATVRALARKR